MIGAEVTFDESNQTFVAYRIEVTGKSGEEWAIARRYTDFCALRDELIKLEPMIEELPFPDKTFFGSNSADTVDERVYLLGRFCKYMINMIRPGALASFLHKDGSDNQIADLLLVQRYLRSNNRDASDESVLVMDRMMTGIGCRPYTEKNSFLISSKRNGPQVLTIYSLLPDCPLPLASQSKTGHFRSFVTDAKHPFILPPGELSYFRRKNKIMVSRDFGSRGTLRDKIHRAAPTDPHAEKYRRPGTPLKESEMATLGRQLLEGMHYLKVCGLRCTHVHTGNIIMLGNDWCAVTEYEQAILGYRPQLLPLLAGKQEPEVWAFGHCLYEMATGGQAASASNVFLPPCPLSIETVLRAIFYQETPNSSPITLEKLLAMPIFSNAPLRLDHRQLLWPGKEKARKMKKRLAYAVGKNPDGGLSKTMPVPASARREAVDAACGEATPKFIEAANKKMELQRQRAERKAAAVAKSTTLFIANVPKPAVIAPAPAPAPAQRAPPPPPPRAPPPAAPPPPPAARAPPPPHAAPPAAPAPPRGPPAPPPPPPVRRGPPAPPPPPPPPESPAARAPAPAPEPSGDPTGDLLAAIRVRACTCHLRSSLVVVMLPHHPRISNYLSCSRWLCRGVRS